MRSISPAGVRRPGRASHLAVEALEERLTPALAIRFDYSLDATGFFNDPARRDALERAAAEYEARITDSLAAIEPNAYNTWKASIPHPATGQVIDIDGLVVPQDTMIVYVGASPLGEPNAIASTGYSASGTLSWLKLVEGRGQPNATGAGATDAAYWGGAISFNAARNWYAGAPDSVPAGRSDLYTTALHELGHLFGIGESASWDNLIRDGKFVGSEAVAAYGGPVPLNAEDGYEHWADGTTSGGDPAIYNPRWLTGTRGGLTPLDLAALRDIGWEFEGGQRVSTPQESQSTSGPVPQAAPAPAPPAAGPGTYAAGSDAGDAPQAALFNPDGGRRFETTPYETSFAGGVRVVAADVTGDGTADLVVAPGPGRPPEVKVYDGVFGGQVAGFFAFEGGFAGGVHLASGDFNGDGTADLVASADSGGGPRIRVFRGGDFAQLADFFGIDDPNFRGGTRTAAADVNRDGVADLVVGAGFGGGPRVAVYDGRTLASPRPAKLFGDFFAFEQALRNGVFVSAGDMDGDGFADLAFGGGPGGAPRVATLSGAGLLNSGGRDLNFRANFFAGNTADRGGVRVAVKDLDGDGKAGLVVGSGTDPVVSAYTDDALAAASPSAVLSFEPFRTSANGGVYVG